MKSYIAGNLNDKALTTVKYFLKTVSSWLVFLFLPNRPLFSCEAIIFVFLGLSTFSKQHSWDIVFTVVTVAACLIGRFIGKRGLVQKHTFSGHDLDILRQPEKNA